ncbi:MAG: HlyD family type I secretion periplasmic adaptor subunit [Pseudomonadota bacterium]
MAVGGLDRWEKEFLDLEGRNFFERRAFIVSQILLFAVLMLIATLIIWAANTPIDEITRGEGRVIPSSKVQVVQHLEGGILSEIFVGEGDLVKKGQVLMRIESVQAESDLQEKRTRRLAHMATIARLEAETQQRNTVDFPDEVLRSARDIAESERKLFDARTDATTQSINIGEEQLAQKKQELQELVSRKAQLQKSLEIYEREYEILKEGVENQIVPRLDLLRSEQSVHDVNTQIDGIEQSIPRTELAIQEAQSRLEETRSQILRDSQAELNDFTSRLATLEEELRTSSDRIQRSEVRSPADGTVNKIVKNTIGSVISPGGEVFEIVPTKDNLLVEAKIKPQDRANLWPGLPAVIKVSAYNFAVHGGLDGELQSISADTISDEGGEGQEYYRIRLTTDKSSLGESRPIIPGMTVSVDILTGEKTILEYFLKPLLRAKESVLTEK